MNLTCTDKDGKIVIAVRMRRIDAANATIFKDKLREKILSADKPAVVDMKQVDFIDSSGLGALIAVQKMVSSGPGMVLQNLTPTVARAVQVTGMADTFGVALAGGIGAEIKPKPPDK